MDIEETCSEGCDPNDTLAVTGPVTLRKIEEEEIQYLDLTLEQAIQETLANSTIIRNLGGTILESPSNVASIYDPALRETDPRFGVEAALSAFDAQWNTSAFVEKNDRALNNQFFGGGARILRQDLAEYTSEINKRTATGSLLTARHAMDYDFNNAPANLFDNGAWTMRAELEARQPLLQGNGVEFNRIAGPNGQPGVNSGVLLARVNSDVALADFEQAVIELVQDVETAYWELYYSYRDLDAKVAARDRALETWRQIQALAETGQRGGEASREAQARIQYYRLKEDVLNTLCGVTQEQIRTTTFRGTGGVLQNERRLRLLIGRTISDGSLIRPADEPVETKLLVNWEDSHNEALLRRVELRRQKWEIKRAELELVAAKNYLKPRLDAVGRYRWRGFGHDLLSTQGGSGDFDNALEDLVSGDYQEWQLGMEYKFPIGFRQAYAGVKNSQLKLHREKAVLDNQEREITNQVASAMTELDRAYASIEISLARRNAALSQLEATEALFKDDRTDESQRARLLDSLLDAQKSLADADSHLFRAQIEYLFAIRQFHIAKGSLLEYNQVYLQEGPCPGGAHDEAKEKSRRRHASRVLRNFVIPGLQISQGPAPQNYVTLPTTNSSNAETRFSETSPANPVEEQANPTIPPVEVAPTGDQ